MAKMESAAVALPSLRPTVSLALPLHSSQAPPDSSSSSSTVKPGTKYFSNCSRAFWAGKLPPSLLAKSEAPRLRASSSNSSFSSRSFSSSRIWNQLRKVTTTPSPRKAEAASPASELAKTVTPTAARAIRTATTRFTSPFFCVLRSTGINSAKFINFKSKP